MPTGKRVINQTFDSMIRRVDVKARALGPAVGTDCCPEK